MNNNNKDFKPDLTVSCSNSISSKSPPQQTTLQISNQCIAIPHTQKTMARIQAATRKY